MIDFQVIAIRDVLPVNRVQVAHGVSPYSLYLRGPASADFSNTYEVMINEWKSPSVVVVDSRTLLAQVPTQVQDGNKAIRSVVVVSNRLTYADRSRIDFTVSDAPVLVAGMERLIQTFLKILLQTPGTDAFSQKIGGGVLRLVGKLSGAPTASANNVASEVQLAVTRTSRQLIAIQSKGAALPLQEKLLYARLLEARFSPQTQALTAMIDLANQSGVSSVVALET